MEIPTPTKSKGKVKDADSDPSTQNVGEGKVDDADGTPHTNLVEKVASITSKLMANPLAKMLMKV